MLRLFQKFVRGFIVDPALEKEAHQLMGNAHRTVASAQSTLDTANDIQILIVLAGIGLLIAGFIAGRMSKSTSRENQAL